MDNIIFVTQTVSGKPCGVGLVGKLIGESLIKSSKYNFHLVYTDEESLLLNKINEVNPKIIIYNFHDQTTAWVKTTFIRDIYKDIKHVMLHHDVNQNFINNYDSRNNYNFEYVVSPDPTLSASNNIFTVNRLMPNCDPDTYIESEIPIIGFQGFGAPHKGICKIVQQVMNEFDEAIIRLVIPPAYYGSNINEATLRVAEAREMAKHKPCIKIEASHEFLNKEEVVKFLSRNTINCYFYDYLDGAGLATSPDYALAAKRPIAVTKSHQLRNFIGINPSICIEDNSLKDIISFGTDPLKNLYELYSEKNVIKDYEIVMEKILEA